MKTKCFSLGWLWLVIAVPVSAEDSDRRFLLEATSSEIRSPLTLAGSLDLTWESEPAQVGQLPSAVTIRNPFEEPMEVQVEAGGPHLGPGAQLVREHYDPVLGQWRESRARRYRISLHSHPSDLDPGEALSLSLPASFWRAMEESPMSEYPELRLRLAFRLGKVALRSEPFTWEPTASKTR